MKKKLYVRIILTILLFTIFALGASSQTDTPVSEGFGRTVKTIFTYGPAAIIALLIFVVESKIRKAWQTAPDYKKWLVVLYW